LSGSHASVYEESTDAAPSVVFELGVPVLGICYGMQTMAQQLGGRVTPADHREFGYAQVTVSAPCRLFEGLRDHTDASGRAVLDVWMSHGDRVDTLPPGFVPVASTPNAPLAAMADETRRYYAVQFHPEVTHTLQGARLIERFVREICACEARWEPGNIIADAIVRVREQVGSDRVLLGPGVNPGFVMDLLPLVTTGVCRDVRSIRIERVQDASTRRVPFQKKIGAGLDRVGDRVAELVGMAREDELRRPEGLGHARSSRSSSTR
jgi:GMP synthase (glutamine-hydrolysing)